MTSPAPGRRAVPIPAEVAARATVAVDAVTAVDGRVLWVENRPAEGGGSVLVEWSASSGVRTVLPYGRHVGSAVYEYGGGAYAVRGDTVWFVDEDDSRIWAASTQPPGSTPAAVSPPTDGGVRYGDLTVSPDGSEILCVRETIRSGQSQVDVVVLPAAGGGPRVLTSGRDFYAAPRLSPDGRHLAWLSWSNPLLPWDGSWLWTAPRTEVGLLGEPVLIAGGPEESVTQPAWSPDGVLHFLSDRSGRWNLYRLRPTVEPVAPVDADVGVAPWELGYASYTFLPNDGRIAAVLQNGPQESLALITATGGISTVDLPFTSIKPYLSATADQLAFIAASPSSTPEVVLLDTASNTTLFLMSGASPLRDYEISTPDQLAVPADDGGTIHAVLYPPTDQNDLSALSPLIVRPHPGPTANVHIRLDPWVQFFTSHGFTVADVDYRGSTGYGRPYRTALDGRWGDLDVSDCAQVAAHLRTTGRVDPARIFISGASAGGYTALRALATADIFAAGTVRSAVIDPTHWRQAAPPFQRHHADHLIGPWPDTADTYRERSILTGPHRIHRPLLLLHGENDTITPASQAHELARRLLADHVSCDLHIYRGEGHTLSRQDHLQHALQTELQHYLTLGS